MVRSQTIVIGLLCLLLASGYGQPTFLQTRFNPQVESNFNPCDDSLYLELGKRDLNSLSDREYEYFMLKERECSEYKRITAPIGNRQTQNTETGQNVDYYQKGYIYAQQRYDGMGAFYGGCLSGFLGGLIGWGIGTIILNQQEIRIPIVESSGWSATDIGQFRRGYRDYVKEKRSSRFFVGGISGTVLIITVYISSLN